MKLERTKEPSVGIRDLGVVHIATTLFISRWFYERAEVLAYVSVLADREVTIEPPWLTVLARMVLVGMGSLATLYFVTSNTRRDA